jgi:site-specific recombinase XerD
MLNLRWSDVDLARGVMHIQRVGNFRTKDGRRRTLPLDDSVNDFLSAKAVQHVCEYVFYRRGSRIGENYVSALFKRYVEKAGLDNRLHWHSLRHTHASWLVASGASLYAVQKLLGHSSPTVTQIYAHLQPEQLHSTVNRIKIAMN